MVYVDVVVVALLVVVLLVLLSTMREVALLQEKVSIYRQLLLRPAKPSYIGDQVPVALQSALDSLEPLREASRVLLVFLRPDCSACRDLADRLASEDFHHGPPIVCVIGLGPRARRMSDRLSAADYIAINDSDESLFDSAEVRSTPTMILCDLTRQVAEEYSEGSDFEWIRSLDSGASVGSVVK